MKYFVILLFVLTNFTFKVSANGAEPTKYQYGTGLPRDLPTLNIPDENYPNWPLVKELEKFSVINGQRMKQWVHQISDIALLSQQEGNQYWGRLPGTKYDKMTMNLMVEEFESMGLSITRHPFTIPSDWTPKRWQASYNVDQQQISLSSAFPVGKTADTKGKMITAEAIWLGIGAEPDFLNREVKGKAVIIYSTFVPGGRSHSASKRAKIFNANERASRLGAAMIINVMAVPGNGQFNPLGAPAAKYGVPLITINQDEGFRLRDILGKGEKVSISLSLDVEHRKNVATEYVVATLPGNSSEEVVIAAHTDGFFQGALDNASGLASALEIAKYFTKIEQSARARTLVFFLFPDHHHGEFGLKQFERNYHWNNVALALTLEHPSQTQLYWYNDDLMTSNSIGAFRWNIQGSKALKQLVHRSLRAHGVSLYTEMNRKPKLTKQAPGFHIIDHVIYHTTLDIPELVPAEGLERATRAFVNIIEQVNLLTLAELRAK